MISTTDIRDCSWSLISASLAGMRETVYRDLLVYGPCTTAQLANRSDVSILTVRPRITELLQMGLAKLVPDQKVSREGVYMAVPLDVAQEAHEDRLSHNPVQMPLRIPE